MWKSEENIFHLCFDPTQLNQVAPWHLPKDVQDAGTRTPSRQTCPARTLFIQEPDNHPASQRNKTHNEEEETLRPKEEVHVGKRKTDSTP